MSARSASPPLPRASSCLRCGARIDAPSDDPLCARCAESPLSSGHRDPTVIEPVALAAVLAAATPLFVEARDTLAFIGPGKAFALELDYAAILSGLLAVLLAALAAFLLRGTRPEGRAKVVLGAALAGTAGIYEVGLGLGLY